MTAPLLAASVAAALAASAPRPDHRYLQARFGNAAVAQLFAEGFEALGPDDKRLAWELTVAAHAAEPIRYGQLGWRALEVKRLLEAVYLFGLEGAPGSAFGVHLAGFLRRFYANAGNHDGVTGQKFVPEFTPAELSGAAHRALEAGAPLGVADGAALDRWLSALRPAIFDPAFYGPGGTAKALEGFEEVYRAGTPDGSVPPGLYALELSRVIQHLDRARRFAAAGQRDVLSKLIRYLQTGDPGDWARYEIAWVKDGSTVGWEFGFLDNHFDARAHKGAWEGLVHFKDPQNQRLMELLASKGRYFEDKLPWPGLYKRRQADAPVANTVNLVATRPQPPAGLNLPSEEGVREAYGSKSILISNFMDTASAVWAMPLFLEFLATPEERRDSERYSITSSKLLVTLHEVAGHPSGQLVPASKRQPPAHLEEYGSTLEEARADLVALWLAFDPALKELYPDSEQLGRQMYRDFLADGLALLCRTEKGDTLEEEHQRGRWMSVQFLIEKGAAKVKRVPQPEGSAVPVKTYYQVTDFAKMRAAVGELLTRLMVIKATGDHAGIRDLVTRLGVKFDPGLRDEVVARVKAANLPQMMFVIAPRLSPWVAPGGALAGVKVEHGQDFILQHLERTVLGQLPPDEAIQFAAAGASLENLRAGFKRLGAPAAPPPGAPEP